MTSGLSIAVDGPAAAGKSTVARLLAERLGYRYVDTGAMYRALTLKALECGVAPDDSPALEALARSTVIAVEAGLRTVMDGRDVSEAIRSPEVSRAVSLVAMAPGVRRRMVEAQRSLAAGGGVVMEGRDIGTVVLPLADRKFFLTASSRERAARRHRELQDRGYRVDLAALEAEMALRDRLDSEREADPLTPAGDAVQVDTTGKGIEQVVGELLDLCRPGDGRR